MLEFFEVEDGMLKPINIFTHVTSGKTFEKHTEDSKIIKYIECMEQVCSVNGDVIFVYKPVVYFNKTTKLQILKKSERSE